MISPLDASHIHTGIHHYKRIPVPSLQPSRDGGKVGI